MDRSQWRLEIDSFAPKDQQVITAAVMVEYAKCLHDGNMQIELPPIDPDDFKDNPLPVTNDNGRRLFDVDIAKVYGYTYPSSSEEKFGSIFGGLPEPAASPEGEQCWDGAGDWMPPRPDPTYFSLAADAYLGAIVAPATLEAAQLWKDCLSKTSDTPLPEDPQEMPTSKISTILGIDGEASDRTPSPAEIQLATDDATCRESSGYSETLYREEFRLNTLSAEANLPQLEADLSTYSEQIRLARVIIRSHDL